MSDRAPALEEIDAESRDAAAVTPDRAQATIVERLKENPEPQPFWSTGPGPQMPAMQLMQIAGKNTLVAYLLWFFTAGIGGHRFYLGRYASWGVWVASFYVSLILCVVLIGFVGLFALLVWWIIDAFLIPKIVEEHNKHVAGLIGQVATSSRDQMLLDQQVGRTM